MKELFKSKIMVGVLTFIIGVMYVSTVQTEKLEENMNDTYSQTIAYNLK